MGDAIVKLDDAAAGASLIEQLKVEAPVPGKCGFPASERKWPEEQVTFVHQARPERLLGEISAANREIVG